MAQPTDSLIAGVEAYVAELTDAELDDLLARTRPAADPKSATPPARPTSVASGRERFKSGGRG